MKIRKSFVTNSSSSSFVIVGISDDNIIRELIDAEGIEELECYDGVHYGDYVNFYGGYDEPYYAGINIEGLMETMTLPQMREYFSKYTKEQLNVDIPSYMIKLYYGEVGE